MTEGIKLSSPASRLISAKVEERKPPPEKKTQQAEVSLRPLGNSVKNNQAAGVALGQMSGETAPRGRAEMREEVAQSNRDAAKVAPEDVENLVRVLAKNIEERPTQAIHAQRVPPAEVVNNLLKE
jgi:hypothetical protein